MEKYNLKLPYFLILAFFNFFLFAQEGRIVYNIESIKKNEEKGLISKGVEKEYSLMKFVLNFNRLNSSFELNKGLPYNKKWYNYAKIFSESQYTWFQNSLKKEAVINQEINNIKYQVLYDRMNNWILTEETKNIQGYLCFKAVRKELNKRASVVGKKKYIIYTAWYTPDIPFPFGPIGNGGLPGVILQLSRSNVVMFLAEKITLNDKKSKVKKPKEAERITSEQKIKLMRLARKVTKD